MQSNERVMQYADGEVKTKDAHKEELIDPYREIQPRE